LKHLPDYKGIFWNKSRKGKSTTTRIETILKKGEENGRGHSRKGKSTTTRIETTPEYFVNFIIKTCRKGKSTTTRIETSPAYTASCHASLSQRKIHYNKD